MRQESARDISGGLSRLVDCLLSVACSYPSREDMFPEPPRDRAMPSSLSLSYRRILASWAACLAVGVGCQRANYPLTSDSNCACYQTNETASQFLSHHKFFDFRSLAQHVNVPPAVDDPASSAGANVSSSYFASRDWKSWWEIQAWNNSDALPRGNQTNTTISDATVLMVNSPSNIYLERNTDSRPSSQTYLTMRTVRHRHFQSAAEIESAALDLRYLSVRMKARTRGAPGAITAMFTYRAAKDMSQVQEADLEVRTTDPKYSIQYTNQPSWNDDGDVPGATQNISDPHHVDWGSWQVHRMDWTPQASNWFVNGKLVRPYLIPSLLTLHIHNARARLICTGRSSCRPSPSKCPETAAKSSSTRGVMAEVGVAIVRISVPSCQAVPLLTSRVPTPSEPLLRGVSTGPVDRNGVQQHHSPLAGPAISRLAVSWSAIDRLQERLQHRRNPGHRHPCFDHKTKPGQPGQPRKPWGWERMYETPDSL